MLMDSFGSGYFCVQYMIRGKIELVDTRLTFPDYNVSCMEVFGMWGKHMTSSKDSRPGLDIPLGPY